MRYFKHHEDREIDKLEGTEDGRTFKKDVIIFARWFRIVVGTDEKTNKSFATLQSARKAIEAVESTPVGEYVALEDEDWKLIASIMAEPKGYIPWVNLQLTDWMESIAEAPKKMPIAPGSTVERQSAGEA